jgi:hypothetical protein
MARIKITDDRQGRSFRTGVNGRFYDLGINREIEVDDGMIDHLKGLGVSFEEIEGSKGASASKEGSGEGLAPIGPHDVRAPALDPRSLDERPLAGDQPGDVTASGGVRFTATGNEGPTIEDDARISDIRVAAERRAPKDASVAEVAGEGESGTDETKAPQPVAPSHKETAAEKKAAATSTRKTSRRAKK